MKYNIIKLVRNNSVADDSIKHIREVYAELKRDGTFMHYKKDEH